MRISVCLAVLACTLLLASCTQNSNIINSNILPPAPDTSWSRTFSGADLDFGCALAHTSDGGFVIAGRNSYYRLWMTKLSESGAIEWQAGPLFDWEAGANDIHQTSDGGYVITGGIGGAGGLDDVLLTKVDAAGTARWMHNYGLTSLDVGYDVEPLGSGYLVAGSTESYGAGGRDGWLVRTDDNGDVIWNFPWGDAGDDEITRLLVLSDSGFVAGGELASVQFGQVSQALWLFKADSTGLFQWTRTYSPSPEVHCFGLQPATEGGFLLGGTCGYQIGVPGGNAYIRLIRTDAQGNEMWNKTFSMGSEITVGKDLAACEDGGYLIAGYGLNGNNGNDLFLMKVNAQGDLLWETIMGGNGDDRGTGIEAIPGGGAAASGFLSSTELDPCFWVMRLEDD